MPTDEISEKQAFDTFIAEQLGGELIDLSLEQAVAQFREYQRDLNRIKERIALAEEQYNRGDAKPLDDVKFRDGLIKLMDEKGIPK